MAIAKMFGIAIDSSADGLERLSESWAGALGYNKLAPDLVWDPDNVRPYVWFQVVPEAKQTKNRWHLDLFVANAEAIPPQVERLKGAGATELRNFDKVHAGKRDTFTVMLDPQGNEFCVCAPPVPVESEAT